MLTRSTRAAVATLAVIGASLFFAATALANVPAQATTECNNDGSGCRIVDLSAPSGCHVYQQFIGGTPGRIFAHNQYCGYGTVHNGDYWDYEGTDF
jgi:hypothetical protein